MVWLRRAFIALCALPVSVPAFAAVFEQDNRFTPPTEQNSPYAPIGVVRPLSGLGSWALLRYTTGFLVDDCHVLTAQHLLGDDTSPIGKRVRFTGGFTSPTRLTSHGTVTAAGGVENYGGYDRHKGSERYEAARAHDWMLIRLDQCIGKQLGFLHLKPELPAWNVESAGFPNKFFRQPLKLDPSCRVRYRTKLLFLNDCAVEPGNSGSPVFSEVRQGDQIVLEVYAIESAGWMTNKPCPFSWADANIATPVSGMWGQVSQALEFDHKTMLASR
jgi:V8-like Glu-specific endopeptidase